MVSTFKKNRTYISKDKKTGVIMIYNVVYYGPETKTFPNRIMIQVLYSNTSTSSYKLSFLGDEAILKLKATSEEIKNS